MMCLVNPAKSYEFGDHQSQQANRLFIYFKSVCTAAFCPINHRPAWLINAKDIHYSRYSLIWSCANSAISGPVGLHLGIALGCLVDLHAVHLLDHVRTSLNLKWGQNRFSEYSGWVRSSQVWTIYVWSCLVNSIKTMQSILVKMNLIDSVLF